MNFHAFTPMTDTVEIATGLRGDMQPTTELHLLDLHPTVTRYETGRAAWSRRLRRLRRSPFAADVRAAWSSLYWPAVISAGLVIGLVVTVLLATRGLYLAPTGWEPIPAEVAR